MRPFAAAVLALSLSAPASPLLGQTAHSPALTVSDEATTQTFHFPRAGETRVVELPEIKRMLASHGSELLVVNFWATWCSPCVAELPCFVRISDEFPEKRVRVVGISLDLKRDVQTKVLPFLKERRIPYANVVGYTFPEELTPLFSEKWEGELPATFFFDRHGRKLGEKLEPVEYAELKALVEKHLPNE